MNNINDLIGDHLFQLNLVLWLTQPLPQGFTIRPIFKESGYLVHSISQPLALPIPIREKIRGKNINVQDGCSPDVILEKSQKNSFLLVECKKQSFGTNSTTSEQARTLLLLKGRALSEALGLALDTIVENKIVYLTRADQKSQLNDTCKSMITELENAGFTVCPTYCLGIKCDSTNSIYLVIDSNDTNELGLLEHGEIKVIEGQPETDPRPLYFIPLDPSVEQNEYGIKTLEQRLLSEILSLIGRANIPSKIQFDCEELLEKATWGMYGIWGDRNARLNLKRKVKTFLSEKMVSLLPNNFQKEQDKLILSLNSSQDKETILSSFQKTKEIEVLKAPLQLELFEKNENS